MATRQRPGFWLNRYEDTTLLSTLERQSRLVRAILGFGLIGVMGAIDYVTGYELAFSVFYVAPVSLITWISGRWLGLLASLVSALVWLGADIAAGHPYSYPLIPIWNTLIRFAFFAAITILLAVLKGSMVREREFARKDTLTGALNSRSFLEFVRMEVDRSQRYKHPFTLAYIDLDNFKSVNDQFGHSTGDRVLRSVVNQAQQSLRKIDTIARLGGDEFAVLLPETNQESAGVALSKLRRSLLEEMRQNDWPITFSIGVLTCDLDAPNNDDLVQMADDLMYSVKRGSKDAIRYSHYTG